MPKVINQNGVSVDSLQAKLTLLETKFSKLSNEHRLVQDSLRSFDKTLQKADIKTEIFTDQLAFQLFWFTVVLALLGFFSWKYILDPFQKQIEELKTKTIPELKKETRDFMDEEFKRIDDLSIKLSRTIETTVNANYRAFAVQCLESNRLNYLTLYGLRSVHAITKLNDDPGETTLTRRMKTILESTKDTSFFIKPLEKHKGSIMKQLNFLICTENEEMSNLATKIKISLQELFDKSATPTSAIDVDPLAGEETRPSQQ